MRTALLRVPKKGVISRAARGGQSEGRKQRYVIAAVLAIILVWVAAAAYLTFSPKTYTSTFVMVLPGMGGGSALNLASIGSASSAAASAFSSSDLSPTENYRKFLLSHRMLDAAATAADEDPTRFPAPRIELADQTKLITISITGRSPEQATKRAEGIRTALRDVLEQLRSDEVVQRNETYQRILEGYAIRLQESRQRLVAQQARTGLISIEQYSTIVSSVERLRDQSRDVEAKLALSRGGATELVRLLGLTPEQATTAMILRADLLFQAMLDTLAKQEAELATRTAIQGAANSHLIDVQAQHDSVLAKLIERGMAMTGLKRAELLKLRDVSLRDERARLFERLIGLVDDNAAQSAQLNTLNVQVEREQQRVIRLADDVSVLESLRRDAQVAEAVFTSALARIDTSKSDYFSSYPMLQTFEAPVTPSKPSSPTPALTVGGGIAATFLISSALVLSWLRIALFRKMLKNG